MLLSYIEPWASKPFSADMDWINWVLFVAFIITIAFVWIQILDYIIEET
jgi:hypothetical protein